MRRHTPLPPIDLLTIAPEFSAVSRTTVRLHPRRGILPPKRSKIGGPIFWPQTEAWPQCTEHGSPLVPVLQLLAADVPELTFPKNCNLFQLLWCPNRHQTVAPLDYPTPRLFWRNTGDILSILTSVPSPTVSKNNYIPESSILHFERVVEYPDFAELSEELISLLTASKEIRKAMDDHSAADQDVSSFYSFWLSVADGWKVGGFPHWVQDPSIPTCACGDQMELLLTIASAEFDGGTWHRWLAEEDRNVWHGSYEERWAVQCAPDIMLGDMGTMNVFVCKKCEGWPTQSVCQSC